MGLMIFFMEKNGKLARAFCNVDVQRVPLPPQFLCSRTLGTKLSPGQGLEAHTCNPGFSGGRDQEDHGSKPAWANSSQDPNLKKPITKKWWWSDSRCRP
jgi:hypothetical protein